MTSDPYIGGLEEGLHPPQQLLESVEECWGALGAVEQVRHFLDVFSLALNASGYCFRLFDVCVCVWCVCCVCVVSVSNLKTAAFHEHDHLLQIM